jgi:hypothetical protein
MKNWLRAVAVSLPMAVYSVDCTYLDRPEAFLSTPEQGWIGVSATNSAVIEGKTLSSARRPATLLDSTPVPRKNLIDDYVFSRMEQEGIRLAPLSEDQEFLRRVYLDLTGRILVARNLPH